MAPNIELSKIKCVCVVYELGLICSTCTTSQEWYIEYVNNLGVPKTGGYAKFNFRITKKVWNLNWSNDQNNDETEKATKNCLLNEFMFSFLCPPFLVDILCPSYRNDWIR